jgi:3-isopropylmalate/(R)-2-methylmalate dehydratase small subunit
VAIERIREVRGTAVPLRGDNIDTDRIIPARFLKSITFEGLENHLFVDDRHAADAQGGARHPFSNPAYGGASILIVNANFGCGSSREHAPQAIRRRGIRAVIGESFSEIFFGNSVALGMPCVTADAGTIGKLMAAVEAQPQTELAVDIDAMTVTTDGATCRIDLPAGARESFLTGSWDATGLLLDNFSEVEATMARLPYVREWS